MTVTNIETGATATGPRLHLPGVRTRRASPASSPQRPGGRRHRGHHHRHRFRSAGAGGLRRPGGQRRPRPTSTSITVTTPAFAGTLRHGGLRRHAGRRPGRHPPGADGGRRHGDQPRHRLLRHPGGRLHLYPGGRDLRRRRAAAADPPIAASPACATQPNFTCNFADTSTGRHLVVVELRRPDVGRSNTSTSATPSHTFAANGIPGDPDRRERGRQRQRDAHRDCGATAARSRHRACGSGFDLFRGGRLDGRPPRFVYSGRDGVSKPPGPRGRRSLAALAVACDKATPVAPEGTRAGGQRQPDPDRPQRQLDDPGDRPQAGRQPAQRRAPRSGCPPAWARIPGVVAVDGNGSATAILRGDGRSGAATVTATTGDGTVTCHHHGPDRREPTRRRPTLIVNVSPNNLPVEATAQVTVIARNSDGSPVAAGQTVILTTTLGSLNPSRPADPQRRHRGLDLQRGQLRRARPRSPRILGASAPATATVTIRDAATAISVQANPQSVPRGDSTVTLSAFVTNAQGQPLQGAAVTFESERGTLDPAWSSPTPAAWRPHPHPAHLRPAGGCQQLPGHRLDALRDRQRCSKTPPRSPCGKLVVAAAVARSVVVAR